MAGDTATLYDDIHQEKSALPAVFAFVGVLAFILHFAAFRPVAIPLVSIGLNLLSAGAAYGLITLIFRSSSTRPSSARSNSPFPGAWISLLT